MNYDIEREQQKASDLRKAFRECFPLAPEGDLPWATVHIKEFLRKRIEVEIQQGVHHFTLRVARVLCEISPPKTHIEDMCRIVVEEAKRSVADRAAAQMASEKAAERDEMFHRLREIGEIVGCNHIGDKEGRLILVKCVRESVSGKDA